MWKLNLLKWLLDRLSPRVDPGDDETPPAADDDETPPAADDEPPEPKPLSRAQRDIIATRTRAQTAERDLAEARSQLEIARRQPSQPTESDKLWQEEEAVLKNPEADSWQKYAVRSARDSRAANINAQNAILRAEDLADQARFERIEVEKPKLFVAYKDRVDTMLKELRSRGNNAPRDKLLAILVGEDMLSGKLKSAATTSAKPVRASTPGARSDVSSSSRGAMSESERREKRLENVRI